jgi:hypothetical protein
MNITYLIIIISLAFCVFIFFYFRWYIKKRTSVNELLNEYRTEVYRLIAEIDSKTDRDMLLVEDRIKKLNEVLEETDKRIAVYARELDRSRKGEALYSNLGRGIRAALNTQDEIDIAKNEPAVKPTAAITDKPPQLSIVRPNLEVQPPPQSANPIQIVHDNNKGASKRFIRAQIDELANQGVSQAEIASRLDISIAEVDLAMNLRRKST